VPTPAGRRPAPPGRPSARGVTFNVAPARSGNEH